MENQTNCKHCGKSGLKNPKNHTSKRCKNHINTVFICTTCGFRHSQEVIYLEHNCNDDKPADIDTLMKLITVAINWNRMTKPELVNLYLRQTVERSASEEKELPPATSLRLEVVPGIREAPPERKSVIIDSSDSENPSDVELEEKELPPLPRKSITIDSSSDSEPSHFETDEDLKQEEKSPSEDECESPPPPSPSPEETDSSSGTTSLRDRDETDREEITRELQQASITMFASINDENWDKQYTPDLHEFKTEEKVYTVDYNLTVDEKTCDEIDNYLSVARKRTGLPPVTSLSELDNKLSEICRKMRDCGSDAREQMRRHARDGFKNGKDRVADVVIEAIAPHLKELLQYRKGILMASRILFNKVDPDVYRYKYMYWYEFVKACLDDNTHQWIENDFKKLARLVGVDNVSYIRVGCDDVDRLIVPNMINCEFVDKFPRKHNLDVLRDMMRYSLYTKERVGAISNSVFYDNCKNSLPYPFFKALPLREVLDFMMKDPYHCEPLIMDLSPHPKWSETEHRHVLQLITEVKDDSIVYSDVSLLEIARSFANSIAEYLVLELLYLVSRFKGKDRLQVMFRTGGVFYQLVKIGYVLSTMTHFPHWMDMIGTALQNNRGEYPQRHKSEIPEPDLLSAICDNVPGLKDDPSDCNHLAYYATKNGQEDLNEAFLDYIFYRWESTDDNGFSKADIDQSKKIVKLFMTVYPEDNSSDTFLTNLEDILLKAQKLNPKGRLIRDRLHKSYRANIAEMRVLGL